MKEGDFITAKEYLNLISKKDAEIENLQSDLESLRTMLFSLGGSKGDERVQSSRNMDKFGTLYSKIDEKEREIVFAINRLIDFKMKVSREINAVKDKRHVQILHKRYIQGLSFELVSEQMGYTYQYTLELHGYALKQFSRTYEIQLKTYKES